MIPSSGTLHQLDLASVDLGVCSNRLISAVLHEWRAPRHSVFEGRNIWSLFNSFLEALKDKAPAGIG